jgi:hypothetical protein
VYAQEMLHHYWQNHNMPKTYDIMTPTSITPRNTDEHPIVLPMVMLQLQYCTAYFGQKKNISATKGV